MEMETSSPPLVIIPTFQPTVAQLARAAALQRFNRLAVYLPLILFALVGFILLVLMLINALPNEGSSKIREFLSGIADIAVIMAIIPLWLVATAIPIGVIVLFVQMRQRDVSPLRGLQTLLWRIESKVGQLQEKTNELAPKAAAPVITVNARLTFALAWIEQMRHYFRKK